ncbi:hypothetical protein GJ496_001459, partial [Pomphorhynchus laevis]
SVGYKHFVQQAYTYLKQLFVYADLPAECAIIALIYLERALAYGEIKLSVQNWKTLILGAIILASKVWDDQAVWNIDYCNASNDLNLQEMNTLERDYLNFLHFNTNVTSSVYAKYYFELRQLYSSIYGVTNDMLRDHSSAKYRQLNTVRSEQDTSHISTYRCPWHSIANSQQNRLRRSNSESIL